MISKHLMLRLISKGEYSFIVGILISKHLMLRLIVFYSQLHSRTAFISKHLMLRLIRKYALNGLFLIEFQNILCYG